MMRENISMVESKFLPYFLHFIARTFLLTAFPILLLLALSANPTYAIPSISGMTCSPTPGIVNQQINCNMTGSGFATDKSKFQIGITGQGCSPCVIGAETLSSTYATFRLVLNDPGAFTIQARNDESENWSVAPGSVKAYDLGLYSFINLTPTQVTAPGGTVSFNFQVQGTGVASVSASGFGFPQLPAWTSLSFPETLNLGVNGTTQFQVKATIDKAFQVIGGGSGMPIYLNITINGKTTSVLFVVNVYLPVSPPNLTIDHYTPAAQTKTIESGSEMTFNLEVHGAGRWDFKLYNAGLPSGSTYQGMTFYRDSTVDLGAHGMKIIPVRVTTDKLATVPGTYVIDQVLSNGSKSYTARFTLVVKPPSGKITPAITSYTPLSQTKIIDRGREATFDFSVTGTGAWNVKLYNAGVPAGSTYQGMLFYRTTDVLDLGTNGTKNISVRVTTDSITTIPGTYIVEQDLINGSKAYTVRFTLVVNASTAPLAGKVGIYDGPIGTNNIANFWPLDGQNVRSISVRAQNVSGSFSRDASMTGAKYDFGHLPKDTYNITVTMTYQELIDPSLDRCSRVLPTGTTGGFFDKKVVYIQNGVQNSGEENLIKLPIPVVMIHGINSSYQKWFKKPLPNESEDTTYWDNYLRSVGYVTLTPNYTWNISDWDYVATNIRNSIEKNLKGLSSKVVINDYNGLYPKWNLIGHSQGGLVTRVMIYYDRNRPQTALAKQVKGIFLLGTPNSGGIADALIGFCASYLSQHSVQTDFNWKYPDFGGKPVMTYAGTKCWTCGVGVPTQDDRIVPVGSVYKIDQKPQNCLLCMRWPQTWYPYMADFK